MRTMGCREKWGELSEVTQQEGKLDLNPRFLDIGARATVMLLAAISWTHLLLEGSSSHTEIFSSGLTGFLPTSEAASLASASALLTTHLTCILSSDDLNFNSL